MPRLVLHEWSMPKKYLSFRSVIKIVFHKLGFNKKDLLFEEDFSPDQSLKALETASDSV